MAMAVQGGESRGLHPWQPAHAGFPQFVSLPFFFFAQKGLAHWTEGEGDSSGGDTMGGEGWSVSEGAYCDDATIGALPLRRHRAEAF